MAEAEWRKNEGGRSSHVSRSRRQTADAEAKCRMVPAPTAQAQPQLCPSGSQSMARGTWSASSGEQRMLRGSLDSNFLSGTAGLRSAQTFRPLIRFACRVMKRGVWRPGIVSCTSQCSRRLRECLCIASDSGSWHSPVELRCQGASTFISRLQLLCISKSATVADVPEG